MNVNKIINHGNGLMEYIQHWNDDNIGEHYTMLNGKLYGEYKSYHHNGKLWFHSYYKNGKIEGEQLGYYL